MGHTILLTLATQPRQRRRQGEHCHHDDRGGADHLGCLLFRMSGLLDEAVSLLRISLSVALRRNALPVVVVQYRGCRWMGCVLRTRGHRFVNDGS
jgi:hypothetical protein